MSHVALLMPCQSCMHQAAFWSNVYGRHKTTSSKCCVLWWTSLYCAHQSMGRLGTQLHDYGYLKALLDCPTVEDHANRRTGSVEWYQMTNR